MTKMNCPRCGGECTRPEVLTGSGVMLGEWSCTECNWREQQPVRYEDNDDTRT